MFTFLHILLKISINNHILLYIHKHLPIHHEINHINNEINLLQDLVKKNEKSKNQSQNGLMRIGRIRVKQGQSTNLSQTKKIQNILKNISKNKIKHIKKG